MPRGSESLAKAWKTQGALDQKMVAGLVDELDKHIFNDILVKGQPKPDWARMTAVAEDPERCGNSVTAILKMLQGLGGTGHVIVFPKGIPFPDQFHIEVQVGSTRL